MPPENMSDMDHRGCPMQVLSVLAPLPTLNLLPVLIVPDRQHVRRVSHDGLSELDAMLSPEPRCGAVLPRVAVRVCNWVAKRAGRAELAWRMPNAAH